MLARALLLLLLALPAAAQEPTPPRVSSSSAHAPVPDQAVDIYSIGGYRFTLSMPLLAPFERLLKERGPEVRLLTVDNVPVYFQGNRYRFNIPPLRGSPAPVLSTAPTRGRLLESEYGFLLFSDPQPELLEAFRALAARPESYRRPLAPLLALRPYALTRAEGPDGTMHLVDVESPRPSADQWRKGLALVYRLWIKGRAVDAVFIYKTQGGLGRLASAIEAARKDGSPALLVSRGTLAARDASLGVEGRARIEALERLGLRASAVGLGELRSFDDLQQYRRDKPDGVRFLSANLVVSSATASTVLPASAILEAGGLKIALLGLTRPSYKKYLAGRDLKVMTLTDPVEAALSRIRDLRERADAVVVLSNLDPEDNLRLSSQVRGIDLILSNDESYVPDGPDPLTEERVDPRRRPYDPCLLVASEFSTAVSRLRLSLGPAQADGARRMGVHQTHLVLDESVPEHEGYPEFASEAYGVVADTRPALLPAARIVFPEGSPNAPPGFPTLASRDFWSLGASLLARRAGAEAGLLPVLGISVRTTGDFNEAMVRDWFPWEDSAVVFELSGADLLELLRSVHDQAAAEKAEQPIPGRQLRLAAGGLGDSDTVHGVPIEPALTYRVAASELLLANVEGHPALGRARNVTPLGDLREIVLSELRSLADSRPGPERYARLMGGAPVAETPLWKVNFRDISINASNTKVLKDSAFSRVPNSRVQGFDQQLIGMTAKIDADYLLRDFKWSNGFVLEYSQARLSPPDQPRVINTPNNRLSFLTTATRRVGSFPVHWLARSYGPSLGFQYEGEVEKNPGLKRKHIFYAYPGVEFFGGDVMKTVELSANFKRDYSRDVPNNQYGLRGRALGSLPIHKGLMTLNGETWVNYFVRSRTDTDQDLGLEGDANFKLQIPIYQHLTLAPFIDFYYFRLKVRPLSGYSAITGLSLGFSRLWKPQYEKF